MNGPGLALLVAAIAHLSALIAQQPESANPEQAFRRMFGDRWDHARRSTTRTDDLQLVEDLRRRAGELHDDLPLEACVLLKAFDLAMVCRQFELARSALVDLQDAQPKARPLVAAKLLCVSDREFGRSGPSEERDRGRYLALLIEVGENEERAGDLQAAWSRYHRVQELTKDESSELRIEACIRVCVVRARQAAPKKLEALHRKLAADPEDRTTAGAIARVLAVDCGDLVTAQPFAARAGDDDVVGLAALRVAPEQELTAADHRARAEWYLRRYFDKEREVVALWRAKQWYEQYAADPDLRGQDRVCAAEALRTIAGEAARRFPLPRKERNRPDRERGQG